MRTTFGPAILDKEGLFRVALKGEVQPIIWIPAEAKDMQAKLTVCTHMGNGHRGTATTFQVMRSYCVWQDKGKDVENFVKKCLQEDGAAANGEDCSWRVGW